MATTKKYKFSVWTKDGRHANAIIEATSMSEATRLAKLQFAAAKSVSCMGEVR